MAKITGLSGMIQGKVGPTVYRVSRGVQIASQYNPNPANPRSPAQTDQRSVFGSAVQLAKSAYDDALIGPLYKTVQYKQRTNLISDILKFGRSVKPYADATAITTKSSLINNWIPGFETVDIVGSVAATDLTVDIAPIVDGSLPSIAGVIVVLAAGPIPNMSIDDLVVFNVADHVVSQGVLAWASSPIAPGASGSVTIPVASFEYADSVTGTFLMPEASEGRGGFVDLGNYDQYKCWYVIPLSFDYDGFGLRTTIDDHLVTVGKMQLLWEKPGA